MERKIQAVFIIAVLALFAVTIIAFDRTGTVSKKEKRTLAARPRVLKENRLNADYFDECSSYLDDRFGGRPLLISLDSKLKYGLQGKVSNERALAGKDGWLFFIDKGDFDNLGDFLKKNLLSDEAVAEFKDKVARTADWCSENGIKCVFMVCPNKHSVYAEYYPFPRPEGITRADQLTAVFEELQLPYLYPRDYLIARKKDFAYPLYYETDTHWNPQGAYLSFTQLREQIGRLFPEVDFPDIEYEASVDYSMTEGDILAMLHLDEARSTQPRLTPAAHEAGELYTYLKNEEAKGVITEGRDRTLPRALVFRDSFFDILEPFVSPLFSHTEYIWKNFGDEDKAYVLEYRPDILIFERVERAAPCFIQ